VAKSVVSMLFGVALKDGSIRNIDDSVTSYVDGLRDSPYDGVTIRQLLQMSSGVAWNEDYADEASDIAQISKMGGLEDLLSYMKRLHRTEPPGKVFNYNTGETHIAGAILGAATRGTLSEYLSEKIWKPAGMESDAYWRLLGPGDLEHAGCCISATLRDYGRIGLLALTDGVTANGSRLLPAGWMTASTAPAPANAGYGHFWWLEGSSGAFAARGVFGQYIYIDPSSEMVLVLHSLWPRATDRELSAHRTAFVEAMGRTLKDN
jgi:CubicO group peptidase (beta-lactamase class C family)